jgi:hypothetical protein
VAPIAEYERLPGESAQKAAVRRLTIVSAINTQYASISFA